MPTRSSLFAALWLLSGLVQAHAADEIVARVLTEGDGDEAISQIWYAHASCEEECHVATLACDKFRDISLTIADVPGDKADAILNGERQFIEVVVARKTFQFFVSELDYMEMTGTWWLVGHLQADKDELAKSFSAAKSFVASVADQRVELQVNDEIRSWARSCVK